MLRRQYKNAGERASAIRRRPSVVERHLQRQRARHRFPTAIGRGEEAGEGRNDKQRTEAPAAGAVKAWKAQAIAALGGAPEEMQRTILAMLTGASKQNNTATTSDPRRMNFYDTDEAAELERNANVAAQATVNGPAQGNEGGVAQGKRTATSPRPSIAQSISMNLSKSVLVFISRTAGGAGLHTCATWIRGGVSFLKKCGGFGNAFMVSASLI